jgi:hypothetical protein
VIVIASAAKQSAVSLPGLTRQSIFFERFFRSLMDARVKPAHDEVFGLLRRFAPRNDEQIRTPA